VISILVRLTGEVGEECGGSYEQTEEAERREIWIIIAVELAQIDRVLGCGGTSVGGVVHSV
jgi:hypothetical protein